MTEDRQSPEAVADREGGAEENSYCALGTGKTHIGHLDCAAGVTGLIKTIQQFRHEKIPALLHFMSPNPRRKHGATPRLLNHDIRTALTQPCIFVAEYALAKLRKS